MKFIDKVVEPTNKKVSRINAVVVWKDNVFFAKVNDTLYPIADSNVFNTDKYHVKYIYSLPTNDQHPEWMRKETLTSKFSNPELIAMWWGKYKDGMRIKGNIVNNIFHESSIPTITKKSKR